MTDDLYPDAIIALARKTSNQGRLANPHASVTVDNPLCGDRITLDISWADDGTVSEVAHLVRGCILCQAAAAVLSDNARGRTDQQLVQAAGELKRFLDRKQDAVTGWCSDLAVFEPVRSHNSRLDCVLLPFTALLKGLGTVRSASPAGFEQ